MQQLTQSSYTPQHCVGPPAAGWFGCPLPVWPKPPLPVATLHVSQEDRRGSIGGACGDEDENDDEDDDEDDE